MTQSDDRNDSNPRSNTPERPPRITRFGFGNTLFTMNAQGEKKPLPEVSYRFASSDVPHAQWAVQRLHMTEAISSLYSCTLDLVSDLDDPTELFEASVTLEIHRAPLYRRVHGVVVQVDERGMTDQGKVICQVVVAPAFYALTTRINTRVWTDKTTLEIVSEVLAEGLAPFQRTFDLSSVSRDRPTREVCVQYNESDYDFVARLLDDEGIAFLFKQEGKHEELVLVDNVAAYQKLITMDYRGRVPVMPTNAETAEIETVQVYQQRRSMQTTSVVLRDRDFTRPELDLTHETQGHDARGRERESYAWAPHWVLANYEHDGSRTYNQHDGQRRIRTTRERLTAHAELSRGTSNATCLELGRIATVGDARHGQPEEKRVVVEIEHTGEVPETVRDAGETSSGRPRYANRFVMANPAVLFRSRPLPMKPMIHGTQTATVVGPQGEEIFTDDHGRIKVRFHWDRIKGRNERASAWVRVAQSWSGPGFGGQVIPRVGMEVVISFESGNPDRPLVIGCVYNGSNMHPTPPRARPTVSTFRTRSSPGGSDDMANELRFEDAFGEEEVHLRAQRDLTEEVLRDRETRIGHDREMGVGHDERVTIGHDAHRTVDNDQMVVVGHDHHETVRSDRSVTVERDARWHVQRDARVQVDHDRETRVTGDDTLRVSGRSLHVHAGLIERHNERGVVEISAHERTEIQGDFVHKTKGSSAVTVGTAKTPRSHSHHTEGTSAVTASKTLRLHSDQSITLTCGTSFVRIGPERIELISKEVVITGEDALVKLAAGKASVSADKKSVIRANKVLLRGKSSSVSLADEAWIDGASVKLKKPDNEDKDDVAIPKPTKIALTDDEGRPLAGERFLVRMGDGTELSGTLDENGKASVLLDADAQIEFPEMGDVGRG